MEKHNDTHTKKRNRFKKDASGAIVRFPSEMTIDDARRKMGLDQPTYRLLRAEFRNICTSMHISKKSTGSEKWEIAKTRLLHQLPQLYHKLWTPSDELEIKQVALDAICRDTAKRMRLMDSRMTQAEVKNVLGINPQQARDIRVIFNKVLVQSGFANKPDSPPTPQQWDSLRRLWGKHSAVIRRILDDINGDPNDHFKARALDVLSRDILKRLRDKRSGRDSKKQRRLLEQVPSDASQLHPDGLGTSDHDMSSLLDPQPPVDQVDLGSAFPTSALDCLSEASYTPQTMMSPPSGAMAPYLPSQPPPFPSHRIFSGSTATQSVHLDPTIGQSLLLAANADTTFLGEPYGAQPYGPAPSSAQMFHHEPPISSAFAVYFRTRPSSTFMADEPLWIGTMGSKSLHELRQVAVDKLPGAACLRVEGILRDRNGREIPVEIEDDLQLAAYLTLAPGGTPVFNVQLVWK
ncbi:hypothetical protein Trco_002549 [Trichoderma cornu-damae]|uniref:Clr5 domain-containing protein n=1 Tax=Trichoderma cornu-damae TaxID=654480 RepID=A0A9P8TY44_9HYPO|nr:hypothetical protein Trco_002549 [Trichoderma cornu-damae]